jgi:hypothetical protein
MPGDWDRTAWFIEYEPGRDAWIAFSGEAVEQRENAGTVQGITCTALFNKIL